MDIKGTQLSGEIATSTNDKIEEIRKNIFSIYAKEFNLKRKRDKSNDEHSDKEEDPRSTKHKLGSSVTDSIHVDTCENSSSDHVKQDEHKCHTSENEHSEIPETENRPLVSVEIERSPIRVNTTSFSVADILDPGKFTGVKVSPPGSWHPWLQRGDRGPEHDDSDDECMIDESGIQNIIYGYLWPSECRP